MRFGGGGGARWPLREAKGRRRSGEREDGRRVEKRIELFFFSLLFGSFAYICSTRKLYFASCRTKEWMDDFVINN